MMRYFALSAVFTTQVTFLARLPDIPGWVVQVHLVHWAVASFGAATSIAVTLDHNINLAITLSTNSDSKSQWFGGDQGANLEGPPAIVMPYRPPYELIGTQRFDVISAVGQVSGKLIILYTLRRETNRTLWNEIRSRTSFERD